MHKKTYDLEVQKVRGLSDTPAFLGLLHRHFEKSKPTVASSKEATLTAPVDLLSNLLPSTITENIEAIEIHYRRSE